jgi:hypothetical protein
MFSAHGIAVVIGAEHHASLLGPLGGSFLSLDIWVDEADREEAVALLRDLREHDEAAESGDGASGIDDVDVAGEADEAGRSGAEDGTTDDPGSSVQMILDRRRRTGAVLLLGGIVTFGSAHMFTRAWLRGMTLAAVEIAGILQLQDGHAIGGGVIAAAILTDVIGALRRVWAAPAAALPAARIRRT